MTKTNDSNKGAKEVAERLQGLKWFRVDFDLYGSVEVKAKDKDEAAQKAFENYDWTEHVDSGEVVHVEEEQ